MQMSITKSYSQSVTIKYQTWKYATTLSKTINVNSAKELQTENEKLWKQAKMLTNLDMKRDEANRDALLTELRKNNIID